MGNNNSGGGGGAAGGGSGDGLGEFLAEFAAGQEGQHVASEMQGTTECWDLAMAAIEHAEAAGYSDIDWDPQNPYEWGHNVVDLQDAQTGDIVQWSNYNEKVTKPDGSWTTAMTGYHHTSIVAEPYDGETFKCWGQNPDPVTLTEYHPDSSTGGTFTIYRLACSGESPHSDDDESDADHSDDDDNSGWEYYTGNTSFGPYYWKAADGYDPYKDGYYWYNEGETPADAQWYSYQ